MGKGIRKSLNVAIVAATIFAFGATPALANPNLDSYQSAEALASITPQALSTMQTPDSAPSIDHLLDLASIESGPTANFDVEAALAIAESEIGTSRATGWAMPGECIMSTKRWINHAGGNWNSSGTPRTNYDGAALIPLHLAQPGDIVQYENAQTPDAWVTGVHTLMISEVHEDGTIDIIQSNVPFGSGLVTKELNWQPDPPAGFQTMIWRF